jgi:hypothetical protein
MALIALILFTAALGAVAGVLWFTLLPAMPRMIALLRGDAASSASVSPPAPSRVIGANVLRTASRSQGLPTRMPLAA